MDLTHAAQLTLMVFGASLAVWGHSRRRAHTATPFRPFRLLRMVWDLTAGLVLLVVFSAVALAPRTAQPPRLLSLRDARAVLAGQASARRNGKAKR